MKNVSRPNIELFQAVADALGVNWARIKSVKELKHVYVLVLYGCRATFISKKGIKAPRKISYPMPDGAVVELVYTTARNDYQVYVDGVMKKRSTVATATKIIKSAPAGLVVTY